MEQCYQLGVVLGFAISEWRRHHHNGSAHIGREDIAVVSLEAHLRIGTLHLRHHGREESERVAHNIPRHNSARRQHQHLQIAVHLLGYILLIVEQLAHSLVITLCEKIGDIVVDERRNLHHSLHIESGSQIAAPILRVQLSDTLLELVDGTHRRVGIVGVVEEYVEAVCSRDILIYSQRLLLRIVEWQEVGYILAKSEIRYRHSKEQNGGNERGPHRFGMACEVVVYAENHLHKLNSFLLSTE